MAANNLTGPPPGRYDPKTGRYIPPPNSAAGPGGVPQSLGQTSNGTPKGPSISDRVRSHGEGMVDFYDTRGKAGMAEFDPASRAVDDLANDRPDYVGGEYRKQSGAGTKPVTNATSDYYYGGGAPAPTYSRTANMNLVTGSQAGDRYDTRAKDPRRNYLGDAYGEVDAYGNAITNTEERLKTRTGNPQSYDTDRAIDNLESADFGAHAGVASAQVNGFTSKSGDYMGELAGYDAARRVDEARGRDMPEYAEDLYMRLENEEDPYYNRLEEKTMKAMERAAAARGGYNAGSTMRQQGEAVADLRGKQFQERKDLAVKAQGLRQDREGDLIDAAARGDTLGMDLVKTRAGLAAGADDLSKSKIGALSDLAMSRDRNFLSSRQSAGQLSGQRDELGQDERDALDDLAGSADDKRHTRQKYSTDYLGDLEDKTLAGEKALDELAGKAGDEANDSGRLRVDAAKNASGEAQDDRDFLRDTAEKVDDKSRDDRDAGMERDRDMGNLAKGASEEQRNFRKDIIEGRFKIAEGKSGLKQLYDAAAGATLTETEMSALDIELQKLGLKAKERKEWWETVKTGGGAVVGGTIGGFVGGPAGILPGAVAGGKVGKDL